MLRVAAGLSIPLSQLVITQIRAQGSGGQNVNKVASAVQLRFDISSSTLPDPIKEKLLHLGDSRITKDGIIIIKSQNHRTFERNRTEALERLGRLIKSVMVTRKRRKPTRPSRRSQQKRIDKKVKHGKLKTLRKKVKLVMIFIPMTHLSHLLFTIYTRGVT